MSQKEIDYADIKYLIENYRQACESEEFDEFLIILVIMMNWLKN